METLERLIEDAQRAGSLDAGEDAPQLAFELEAFLLMGNATFVLDGDPTHLRQARTAIAGRLSRNPSPAT